MALFGGAVVTLALVFGAASTALAGTGVGARFDLGKTNTVNVVSRLVGSVAGPSLRIDNNSAASGATALDLQVEPGKPPMTVNSSTKVEGLNADSLDGADSFDFARRDPETGAAFEANIARNADRLDGKDSTQIGINGVQRVTNTSEFDTFFRKTVTATCPAGKVVVGTGYDKFIEGELARLISVDELVPSASSVTVTAREVNGLGENWSIHAIAICATAP